MQIPDIAREKRTILLAQGIISFLMALIMTFLFSIVVAEGLLPGWPLRWLHHFIAAWPTAFALSLVVGPISFKLAFWIMHRAAQRG
jgi:hypothetical protein